VNTDRELSPLPDPTDRRDPHSQRERAGGIRPARLLLEMGVIVFSVMVALVANEWRQGAARRATVAAVLETVIQETSANRAQMERALEHHRELVAQLRSGGIEMQRLDLREVPVDTTSAAAFGRSLYRIARSMGATFQEEFTAERLADGRWEVSTPSGQVWVTIQGDTAILRGTGNIALNPAFLVDSAWETAQVTQAAVHMDPEVVAAMARIRQLHRMMDGTIDRLIDMLYGTAASGASPLSALQDLVMFEQRTLEAYDDLLERLGTRDPPP
jgi:hypothetical protein